MKMPNSMAVTPRGLRGPTLSDAPSGHPRAAVLAYIASMARRVAYRTCPFCAATCRLELHLEAPNGEAGIGRAAGREEIVLVRGDRDDVFSHGFLCPKG